MTWIGSRGPIAWLPRSPDLNSWCYLKNIAYEQKPTSREDMKETIRIVCKYIRRAILLRTVEHLSNKMEMCLIIFNISSKKVRGKGTRYN